MSHLVENDLNSYGNVIAFSWDVMKMSLTKDENFIGNQQNFDVISMSFSQDCDMDFFR